MISFCNICHNLLPQERIDALKFLGKMPYDYDCFSCATIHGRRKQGIFTGLSGISNLVITDNAGPIQHLSQQKEENYSEPSELDVDNDGIDDKISQ